MGDLSTDAGADAVAAAAKAAASGGIDILINNAGGGGETARQGWLNVLEVDWDATYQVNTIAAVRMIRRLVPGMAEAGWGRIIEIGSAIASQPGVLGPDYASAKAAIQSLSVGLAKALANTGITVNTVSPGIIATGTLLAFARAIAPREGWGKASTTSSLASAWGATGTSFPSGASAPLRTSAMPSACWRAPTAATSPARISGSTEVSYWASIDLLRRPGNPDQVQDNTAIRPSFRHPQPAHDP